jgi:hypothetical protein
MGEEGGEGEEQENVTENERDKISEGMREYGREKE